MASAGATLEVREQGESLSFLLTGRLDSETTGTVWRKAFKTLEQTRAPLKTLDATGVEYCDGAGIRLLVELRRRGGPEVEIRGLADRFRPLLELFPPTPAEPIHGKPQRPSLTEEVGRATMAVLRDMGRQVTFIGELMSALGAAVVRP